jgi:hypothetical protein
MPSSDLSRERRSGSLAFLTARAWLDEDGRHVWLEHDCGDERARTMLPSTWQADAEGHVSPSIDCRACGAHFFAQVEAPPEDE